MDVIVNPRSFDSYNLFYPLYEKVKQLLGSEELIPCNDGNYVSVKYAKIARQEKLASLLKDDLLTSLVNDGNDYHWLPTFLTETNREYEQVYRLLTGELKINVVRPEDLRILFAKNPVFLPKRDDDWIAELYLIANFIVRYPYVKNATRIKIGLRIR